MKMLLSLLIFGSAPALARTQAIFAADGTKATVLLISMTSGDMDAVNLYNALAVPEENIDGKRTKRLTFDNAAGARALSIVCVLSAFVAANGTCTVILHATANTSIDKGSLTARLAVVDPIDLGKLVPMFVIAPAKDLIFVTADGHLSVTASQDNGAVTALEVNYR